MRVGDSVFVTRVGVPRRRRAPRVRRRRLLGVGPTVPLLFRRLVPLVIVIIIVIVIIVIIVPLRPPPLRGGSWSPEGGGGGGRLGARGGAGGVRGAGGAPLGEVKAVGSERPWVEHTGQ